MQNDIVKLKTKQSDFLKNIFDKFDSFDNTFNKIKFNLKTSTFSNDKLNQIPSFDNYTDDIKEIIKNMEKDFFNCTFSVHERSVDLCIILDKHEKDKKIFIQNILRKTFIWLHTAHSYSDKTCSKKLYIYMFMTPALKLLPMDNSVLSQDEINTAFTYTCKHDNEIHIFRKEEWFKVLIHETFHNYNLDFSKFDNGYSNRFAKKIFNLSVDFRMYESYCEFWATIFNCVYFLYFENKIHTKNFNKQINECINKELQHSFFQCVKILEHFGMSYTDLYSESEKARFARIHKYKENTPIISYYFFKTILLFNCNKFIEWCLKENDNSISFSNNTKDIYKKIEMFADFINKYSKNENFVNQIKKVQKEFQDDKKKISSNDIITYVNLKMTYYNTE